MFFFFLLSSFDVNHEYDYVYKRSHQIKESALMCLLPRTDNDLSWPRDAISDDDDNSVASSCSTLSHSSDEESSDEEDS